MTSDMLCFFLGWTIFVEISSLTKYTFGLGTAVCNILWGETLLIASAKSFILNGFKSQFFSGSNHFFGEATNGLFFFLSFSVQYFFDLGSTHWHCLYRQNWSNPFEMKLQHNTFQVQHGYMFLPYQPYTCNGRSLFLLYFQVLSKVCGIDPLLTEISFIDPSFSLDDTVFTSWKIMALQRLKPSWFIATVCFTIL